MATRYIAILARDAQALAELTQAMKPLPGFTWIVGPSNTTIYVNSREYILLPAQTGVVLGRLFNRSSSPQRVWAIDDSVGRHMCNTRGAYLISNFWGSYVTILSSAIGHLHVIRDPSGAMPAYTITLRDAVIVASDPMLLVEAGLFTPEIDWAALADHLVARDLRTPRTCLTGLAELMAGTRLSLTPAGPQVHPVWSPWDFTTARPDHDDRALAEYLHTVVQESVRALATGYNKILLGVSGGLDSSILAACLKDTSVALTCFTMATREPEGDERMQARTLCRALDLPLIETFHDLTSVDIERVNAPHLPRPIGHPFGQSVTRIKYELEQKVGADALFGGVGGDNVFCFTQSATPLVDRFRTQGLTPGLLATLDDICRQNQCSVGEALRMALARHRRRDPAYIWEGDRSFLTHIPTDNLKPRLHHPWLDAPVGALPGKAVHIAMLARLQGTIDGLERSHAPQVLPLISQPIVEACLTIPMWRWISGGRNRAVARNAFADVLPSSVINRQSKGGPNSFAYEVMELHKALICDRLTTGRLKEAGLLDTDAIRAALSPSRLIKPPNHLLLSLLTEAEAWVRHWEGVGRWSNKKVAAPFN